jgi:hypothetical protein
MWEKLIFRLFLLLKIQNKFPKKPKFWKEKSVENVVTIGPTAQAALVNMI